MDWFLAITTLLVNSGLGWSKGAWWMWVLHAINALIWVVYSLVTKQYGFVLLSAITIVVDLLSIRREEPDVRSTYDFKILSDVTERNYD
jgi:hypothetical protein